MSQAAIDIIAVIGITIVLIGAVVAIIVGVVILADKQNNSRF